MSKATCARSPAAGRARRESSSARREKFAAFRSARAALAASGTVTLELALAGVPLVGAYKVSGVEALLRPLVTLPFSVLLPNLVLGEAAIAEFLQGDCQPQALATALAALICRRPGPLGPARRARRRSTRACASPMAARPAPTLRRRCSRRSPGANSA